jgi:hypothetical protein
LALCGRFCAKSGPIANSERGKVEESGNGSKRMQVLGSGGLLVIGLIL